MLLIKINSDEKRIFFRLTKRQLSHVGAIGRIALQCDGGSNADGSFFAIDYRLYKNGVNNFFLKKVRIAILDFRNNILYILYIKIRRLLLCVTFHLPAANCHSEKKHI